MSESQAGAVTPNDRARATKFAYVSLACALSGLVWMLVRNELGEPNLLLVLPCVALSVLSVVLAVKSLRRPAPRLPRAAAIVGLVVGLVGGGIGGLYLLLMGPFLLWAILGSA